MTNKEHNLLLSTRLGQLLVDYLKTRPYVEVSSLIDGLLKLPRVQVSETQDEAPAKDS